MPDKHIAVLIKKKDRLKIREADFNGLLKPYNLQDILISLGRWSIHTHFTYDEHRVGKTLWEEPKARVLVTQQALAYLANVAFISRAGDYKTHYLSKNEDNVPALCAIYNDLPDPLEFEDELMSGEERFQALVLRCGLSHFFNPFHLTLSLSNSI
ncbi:MAG: hypothetical protein L6427_11335 [Actinomycetia bacterium]|nr:hypothetical protein [Actinomycetes bacterium]